MARLTTVHRWRNPRQSDAKNWVGPTAQEVRMRDPDLNALVAALDHMAADSTHADPAAVSDGCELAALRLAVLNRRLGQSAEASPYLAFLRRTAAPAVAPAAAVRA